MLVVVTVLKGLTLRRRQRSRWQSEAGAQAGGQPLLSASVVLQLRDVSTVSFVIPLRPLNGLSLLCDQRVTQKC